MDLECNLNVNERVVEKRGEVASEVGRGGERGGSGLVVGGEDEENDWLLDFDLL